MVRKEELVGCTTQDDIFTALEKISCEMDSIELLARKLDVSFLQDKPSVLRTIETDIDRRVVQVQNAFRTINGDLANEDDPRTRDPRLQDLRELFGPAVMEPFSQAPRGERLQFDIDKIKRFRQKVDLNIETTIFECLVETTGS